MIETIWTDVLSSLTIMSMWEFCAVLLSLVYVYLAANGSLWCWPAALISTTIFAVIFYSVNLQLEAILQLYYMLMAVYGWWVWVDKNAASGITAVTEWQLRHHIYCSIALLPLVLLMGYWGKNSLQSDFAYADAFTTVYSVFTTYLLAKRVLSNWLYWFVINIVALTLYWQKDLYFLSLLNVFYLGFCVYGYTNWKKQQATQVLSGTSYTRQTA